MSFLGCTTFHEDGEQVVAIIYLLNLENMDISDFWNLFQPFAIYITALQLFFVSLKG